MLLVDVEINKYIENHTTPANGILERIERDTYLRSIFPRMLSGHVQGRFLAMISKMIRPESILEIGTFTGYSAICLSEGLAKNGQIHTIEINEELEDQNRKYFEEAGIAERIIPHFGNAVDIIPLLGIQFDLIFIDADKINYPKYFELSMNKLKIGGFILADNVLWNGKVIDDTIEKLDKDTLAVKQFNEIIQNDPCTENVMIPIRDGMTLIQKIC
jgi:predicted O-methyltransferase YrrM